MSDTARKPLVTLGAGPWTDDELIEDMRMRILGYQKALRKPRFSWIWRRS